MAQLKVRYINIAKAKTLATPAFVGALRQKTSLPADESHRLAEEFSLTFKEIDSSFFWYAPQNKLQETVCFL
jgi:hypothetical protein